MNRRKSILNMVMDLQEKPDIAFPKIQPRTLRHSETYPKSSSSKSSSPYWSDSSSEGGYHSSTPESTPREDTKLQDPGHHQTMGKRWWRTFDPLHSTST